MEHIEVFYERADKPQLEKHLVQLFKLIRNFVHLKINRVITSIVVIVPAIAVNVVQVVEQ